LVFFLAQCLPFDHEEFVNPYVQIFLRPPVDQKLRQTSVQPETINPIWNEYFKFGVANETVFKTTKTLYFYIYNYAHSSRPECIGEAQIRLTPQTIHGCDLWCPINKQRAVRKIISFFHIRRQLIILKKHRTVLYIWRIFYFLTSIMLLSVFFCSLKEDEYLGELLVSLTYLAQAERLNVGIIEARNLKALSMHTEAG
jgi:hypothetical protein